MWYLSGPHTTHSDVEPSLILVSTKPFVIMRSQISLIFHHHQCIIIIIRMMMVIIIHMMMVMMMMISSNYPDTLWVLPNPSLL